MADAFMGGFLLIMSQKGVESLLNDFSIRELEYFFTARIRKDSSLHPADIANLGISSNYENYEENSQFDLELFKKLISFSGRDHQKNQQFFFTALDRLSADSKQL